MRVGGEFRRVVIEAKFDSDDTLGTVTITGLPSDLAGFNGGTYTSGTGTWSGTAAQFNALTFTEIGRAACRERAEISVVAGSLKKKGEDYTLTGNLAEEGSTLKEKTS